MKAGNKPDPNNDADTRDPRLSLSLILPDLHDPEKAEIFLQSIKLKVSPRKAEYEVLLASEDPLSTRNSLLSIPGVKKLLEEGRLKILESGETSSAVNNIRECIEAARFDNIMILEAGKLEVSFDLSEFFSIPESLLTENLAVLPEFSDQAVRPLKKEIPVFICRKTVAEYLFSLRSAKSQSYQSAFFYFLNKLGKEPGRYPISQPNPFPPPDRLHGSFPGSLLVKSSSLLNWFFRIPLKEAGSALHKKYAFLDLPSWYRSLFVITALLIAFLLPILSLDAGLSGDDAKHYEHAEKVYNYFASGGEDRSAVEYTNLKLNYYGQSLDLLTYIINRTFKIEKEYEARHFIIAITGVLAILFGGLLATRLAGYRAGLIAMVMIFLAPRFMGHAMNNPMDIPFALGYTFTLYYCFRFLATLPGLSARYAILVMLGIAFTTSIRIGGLLLIPYIFAFSGLYALVHNFDFRTFSREWFGMVLKGMAYLVLISAGGYLFSLVPWPYGLEKPFRNPLEALHIMSDIGTSLTVLFNGIIHWSNELPWYYIPMNILFTVPLLVLAGFLINPALVESDKKEVKPLFIFFLYFAVVFPVAYVIYRGSNVYGGWRHLLFIFPSLAVISAISYDRLFRILRPRFARYALVLVLCGGILHPLVHIIRNHPLQYIYFNELMSPGNAYGRFENDYFTNSLKQGTEWLIENVIEEYDGDSTLLIASNATLNYYLRNHTDKARSVYTRYYDRAAKDWDYAVYFNNYIPPYQLLNGLWPPEGTIKTIDVNGYPVCAVLERGSKRDLYAIEMIIRKQYLEGIPLLEEVNRESPGSEIVKLRLADAYFQTGQYEKVHEIMDECLEIYPNYDKALNMKGIAYLEDGDFENARTVFQQILRVNYRFATAYHNLGLLHIRMNPPEVERAIHYFNEAIRVNNSFKNSYLALAAIYREIGMVPEAQHMEMVARQLE